MAIRGLVMIKNALLAAALVAMTTPALAVDEEARYGRMADAAKKGLKGGLSSIYLHTIPRFFLDSSLYNGIAQAINAVNGRSYAEEDPCYIEGWRLHLAEIDGELDTHSQRGPGAALWLREHYPSCQWTGMEWRRGEEPDKWSPLANKLP
jgi:hypothetical protein